MSETLDAWPAGVTWVFQGTVAEDATAGTHVVTLTVTPGAGNELYLVAGRITVGATATAQVVSAFVDDGTNIIYNLENANSDTTSARTVNLPSLTPLGAGTQGLLGSFPFFVSGTMRLILQVSTAAVSVTQTFSVACRVKGPRVPTATLNDTIGTSTNTTNTSKWF